MDQFQLGGNTSHPSRVSPAESPWRLRPELEWQRPPSEPFLDEPPPDFDFVDPTVSDLPPELDFEQLPRWMRAVPEQGPPEELEFQAGSGPADDWE